MTNVAATSAPSPPAQRGCLRGCLIGVAILFVMGAIALVFMFANWRKVTGAMFHESIAGQIDSTSFPAEEKEEAKAELRRFTDAFEDERYERQDIARGLMVLTESPVIKLVLVNSLQHQYLRKSGLADEEKADGELTIKRFAHGSFTGAIDEQISEQTMEPISTRGSQGELQLKTRVSDEELRRFLASAKEAADAAQVPLEVPAVDLSAEVRRVVDAAIAEAGRNAPDGEGPAP